MPFEPDAALLLCSDGLTDQVSSGSIRRIVEAFAGSPALAVQELLTAANDAGGKDNVTVVIVEGERFAGAVTPRGPRRAGAPAARRRRARHRRLAAGRSRCRQRRPARADRDPAARAGGTPAVGLVAGLILGAGGVVGGAARSAGTSQRLWSRAPIVAGPRTWVVGLEPSADFSNIGEALAKAAAGDTVTVGPGEYREAVTLKTGVQLVGSRDSLLKPPVGAAGDWTAVTARGVTDARLSGFVIGAGPGQPLAIGLLAEAATIEVDGLEVSGARDAGVDLRAGARVTAEQQPDPRQRGPRRHRAGPGGTAPRAQRHHPQRTRAAAAGRRRRRGGRVARARRQRHRRQRRRGGAGLAGVDAGGAGAAQRAVAGAGSAPERHRYGRPAGAAGDAAPAARRGRAGMMVDALDGYLHPELLGGGMSRVYRATRRRDGRVIAVKSVGLASEDVAWAERRGAELQRQFHAVETRVPDVLDIRAGAHELLIEMEYIDGEDLSTVLRSRGRFTPNDAVEVSAALADVLDRAHQFVAVVDGETYHGIVHGDLKPRNIRVCVVVGRVRSRRRRRSRRGSASSTSASPRASAAPPARRATSSAARPTCRPSG